LEVQAGVLWSPHDGPQCDAISSQWLPSAAISAAEMVTKGCFGAGVPHSRINLHHESMVDVVLAGY
jgi:hypothetical protein